jgi:hypothetical protein
MGNFLFDTDFTSLSAALAAAAGRVLVISYDHVVDVPHTVPANTHILADGGTITQTEANKNALEIGGPGVTIEGLEIIGPYSASAP